LFICIVSYLAELLNAGKYCYTGALQFIFLCAHIRLKEKATHLTQVTQFPALLNFANPQDDHLNSIS
jgi:hypothetical protein